MEQCILTSSLPGVSAYEISREDFGDVKVVRLNFRNEVVEPAGLSVKQQRMLGSTLQFSFRDKTQPEGSKVVLFPPFDMGGGSRMVSAKQAKRKLDDYLAATSLKRPLEINNGKRVTVLGVLCVVLGVFSIICSCFVGIWADVKKTPVRRGPGTVIRTKRRD
jgi:hypothetical protein